MKLEALPSWGPTKTKRKLAQGNRLRESLENEKAGEVLPSTKKRKNQTKTSTQRISVAVEALLHPRLQKSSPSPKRHKSRRKKRKHRKR